MLRVLGVLVLVALYISFIVDVVRAPARHVRSLPKWLWLAVVIVLPLVGGVLWWIFGRPAYGGGRSRRGPIAPDDDPRALKEIGDQAWSERMRRRREGEA